MTGSTRTELAQIEPELKAAVDWYFDEMKAEVIKRLEIGEVQYRGRWKELSIEELEKERQAELLDLIAYTLFIEWRKRVS